MRDEDKTKEQFRQELESASLPVHETGKLKAQQLESFGILASGMAHEFNNILTAIIGNIVLAKMYAKPDSEVTAILCEAEKASRMAESLTKQLFSFTRGDTLFKKSVSLQQLILPLTDYSYRDYAVRFDISLPESLWKVDIDEGKIRHAFNNLIINSIQAMSHDGKIRIYGENVTEAPGLDLPITKGNYVKIAIEDTGTGIETLHLDRIFEPFFTTKPKKSGIGLTSTLSIINSHNGHITVKSKVNEGTTFFIYLPAATDNFPLSDQEEMVFIPGRKKVLVMDDEEIVRTVTNRMLTQFGCEATFAKEGQEMIEIYRKSMESGKRFDAVIIDLIIANGMGGKEAIKQLLEIDSEAKALVSSGYSDDLIMSDFKSFGFRGRLPKPYRITTLNRALHELFQMEK